MLRSTGLKLSAAAFALPLCLILLTSQGASAQKRTRVAPPRLPHPEESAPRGGELRREEAPPSARAAAAEEVAPAGAPSAGDAADAPAPVRGAGRVATPTLTDDGPAAKRVGWRRVPPSPSVVAAVPPLIISEFRLNGTNGRFDEFIEIYNNSNSAVTVNAADPSAAFSVAASDGVVRFIIPNGDDDPRARTLPRLQFRRLLGRVIPGRQRRDGHLRRHLHRQHLKRRRPGRRRRRPAAAPPGHRPLQDREPGPLQHRQPPRRRRADGRGQHALQGGDGGAQPDTFRHRSLLRPPHARRLHRHRPRHRGRQLHEFRRGRKRADAHLRLQSGHEQQPRRLHLLGHQRHAAESRRHAAEARRPRPRELHLANRPHTPERGRRHQDCAARLVRRPYGRAQPRPRRRQRPRRN